MLKLTIDNDPDVECPCDCDGMWRLYSFNSRHRRFKDPTEVGLSMNRDADGVPIIKSIGLRKRMSVGLAYFLSYFEHGDCMWFRKGSRSPADMQWDGNRHAGLLVWEEPPANMGAKTLDERQKDADGFLEEYTAWANGHVYRWTLEDEKGEEIDSCSGCYNTDQMFDEIRRTIAGREYEVEGEAGWLADFEGDLAKQDTPKAQEVTA